MFNYKCTLRQFFHDYTPGQIKLLQRQIAKRRARELQELILVTHGEKPQELYDRLQETVKGDIVSNENIGLNENHLSQFNVIIKEKDEQEETVK